MIPENAPQWLKNAITKDADVEITSAGRVLWKGGEFLGGEFRGGYFFGKKIFAVRSFIGLYCYPVHAVVFPNNERWVKMGCLFKSLAEWDQIGIRQSNLREFPDDGSEKSENRAAAFEFAKAAALRLKTPNALKS